MISRATALQALADQEFDVAVIGGGMTGAGVALDAASRGYSVALVERADYASGTSSRSSKLIHGGLRYLQSFDLGLVREALLERQLLVKLAPHLVRPLPLVVASLEGRPDRLTGIGLNMYGLLRRARRPLRARGAGRPGDRGRASRAGRADREGLPDLLAEAVHAARAEQARSAGDVLLRRTRLGLLAARSLDGPDARVAAAIAPELGWDEDRTVREVEVFRQEAEAEGIAPSG